MYTGRMSQPWSRRAFAGALGAFPVWAARPAGVLVESHVHLFASDQQRFPFHPRATYKPAAQPVEAYVEFARQANIRHAVIVHPEPYQDDHRYLEYCFTHELSPGFFKGTCLFDPIAPETGARMEALVRKWPGKIVALRIHATEAAGTPPTTAGPIRGRDLRAPAMRQTWAKAHQLGIGIQMHFVPCHAPEIGALAERFPEMPVFLDHTARAAQGTPAEFLEVLRLARLPRVYMKFCGASFASPEPAGAKAVVRRAFDAFGPKRMLWGQLGMNLAQFDKAAAEFDELFDFASEADRARIRGLNAIDAYRFS